MSLESCSSLGEALLLEVRQLRGEALDPDSLMHLCIHVYTRACMYVCMHVSMYVNMYVSMYVCKRAEN